MKGKEEKGDRAWGLLVLLCLAFVLAMSTWFSATAVLDEIRLGFDLTGAQVAVLTNAVQAGFVVGSLACALTNVADRLPLHRLIAIACAAASAWNAMILIQETIAGLVFARFMTGIALAAIYPPAMKLVATWFRRRRGVATGAAVGALCLGSALPHLLRSLASSHADWRSVILLSSAATAAAACIFLLMIAEGPFRTPSVAFEPALVRRLLSSRAVLLLNIGYFGHMWELYGMWAWIAIYFQEAWHSQLSTHAASLLAFFVMAGGLVGCFVGGMLSDRIGRTKTILWSLAVSGLCAMTIGFFFNGPAWLLYLVALVWGAAVIADSPIYSAAVTELADPRLIGTALSLQMAIGYALTVVAIQAIPLAASAKASWQWVFLVLVPGPVLAIASIFLLRSRQEARRMAGGLK